MKSAGAIQVVIILLLVASAASCEVGKQYANRVFKPTPQKKPDTIALKFMQFDNDNVTDSIDLKDFASKEFKEQGAVQSPEDTSKIEAAINANEKVVREKPADATKRGTTRSKRMRQ